MPFVVGVGRSGTTLLRLMLDAHPDLAIPAETGFIPVVAGGGPEAATREGFLHVLLGWPGWADFALPPARFAAALRDVEPFDVRAGVRCFYRLYAATRRKPRAGDKTPAYCVQMREVAAVLPEARFIHIIRDGRDVALSVKGLWWAPGDDMESIARDWRWRVETTRRLGAACGHYMELRYEDLVEHPEEEIRRVCAFVDLDYDPRMLRYHEGAAGRLQEVTTRYREDGSVLISKSERLALHQLTSQPPERSRRERWKREMGLDDRRRFAGVAGSLLRDLGYET